MRWHSERLTCAKQTKSNCTSSGYPGNKTPVQTTYHASLTVTTGRYHAEYSLNSILDGDHSPSIVSLAIFQSNYLGSIAAGGTQVVKQLMRLLRIGLRRTTGVYPAITTRQCTGLSVFNKLSCSCTDSEWPAAPWWPSWKPLGVWHRIVVDQRIFTPKPLFAHHVSLPTCVFGPAAPSFDIAAVRICTKGCCKRQF